MLGVEVGAEGFNLLLQSFDSFGELSGHVLAFFIHKRLCIVEGSLEGLNLGREFGEHLVVDESLLCGFGIGLQLCDGVGEVLGVDGVIGGEGAFFVLGVEVGTEGLNLLLQVAEGFSKVGSHVLAVVFDEFLGFVVGILKFVELCGECGINFVVDESLFLGSGSGDECGDVALQTFHRFHDALDVVLKRTVVVGVVECCAQAADGSFDVADGLLHGFGILGVRCHLFDFGLGIIEESLQFGNLCECRNEERGVGVVDSDGDDILGEGECFVARRRNHEVAEPDFSRRCKPVVGDDIEGEEYALVAVNGGGGDVREHEASVVGVEGYGSVLRQAFAILEVVESVRLLCHGKTFGEFDATLDAIDGHTVVEEKTDGVMFVGSDGD